MTMPLTLLALLGLLLAVVPASAQQQVLYSNGPINGTVDAWQINFGYAVSDSFSLYTNSYLTAFNFAVWELPGDTLLSLDWSITSAENGGTTFYSGTAYSGIGGNLTDTFLSINQFGYQIDQINVGLGNLWFGLQLDAGTYWLNLSNAPTKWDNPVYWDENSGEGCWPTWGGCPSQASESAFGTIPSEAFEIDGNTCGVFCYSTPEPGTILLFGSGVLCLAGALRRQRF